jgi:hypothetical protein
MEQALSHPTQVRSIEKRRRRRRSRKRHFTIMGCILSSYYGLLMGLYAITVGKGQLHQHMSVE